MNKKEVYIPFGQKTLFDAIKMAIIRKKVDQEKIMKAISWPIAKIMVIVITLAFIVVLSANLKYENIYLQKIIKILFIMIWLGGFVALLKIVEDRILIKFAKIIIRGQQGSSFESERRYGYYEIAEENKRSAESYRDNMLRKAKQRNLYIFFQLFTGLIIAGLLYLNQYSLTAIFMVICQMIFLIHKENLRDYIYSA